MANKKILAAFLLIFSWAVYDSLIKIIEGFPVNLVIFFYLCFYGFVLFVFWIWAKESRLKVDKRTLYALAMPVLLRFLLNLYAINIERSEYNNIVSNHVIDKVTWIFLAIAIFILIKWKRYIV